MSKRILSLFLAVLTLVSTFALPASAAPTLDEAMAEVNVYASNKSLEWLTMNGSVKEQHYTYYNYTSVQTGESKQIPAYCVDPRLYGVPALVGEGTAIKYSAESTVSDPKVCGIIANGYPHMPLSTLGLQSIEEAYYATKTALWIYLLGNWSLDGMGINPNLSGSEKAAAERVLKATRDIYNRGMMWNEMVSPKLTAKADQDTAYPVTINGEQCYQQVITITSETWSVESVKVSLAAGAPDGAKILDMNNQETNRVVLATSRPYEGQVKIVYPASAVEGQTGTAQLNLNSVVTQYAIYYARSLEADKYGNIQDYMLDTDPNIPISASFISRFSSEPEAPDTPDAPDTPTSGETKLRITKLETGTNTPLEGAVFKILYPNGDVVGSFSTDEDGVIEVPVNITGNYTVIEMSPPKNHSLPEQTAQNVTVVHGKTAEVTYHNDPYGNLRVEKKSNTGDPLEGVTIQIKHIASGETQTGKTGPGGAIEFTELKPGGYEVRELAGIKGWLADTDTVQTVSVVTGETSTATFTNKELPGLKILKYDRTTLKVIPDVTFEIWRDSVSLGQFKTDQTGEILLLDAQPGTYLVKEVQSDDAHIVDTTPQQVELKAGDGIKDLVFFNDLKPGLRLVKVDSANPSKVLPNAVFEIRAVDGSYGPEEFTTDENGEIDLSKLPTGAYVVTEKSCPGYVIDQAQRIIELNGNETAEFIFTNSKRPTFTLVKLDSYDSTPLGGVTFRIAKIEDGSHYLDRVTDTNGQIYVDDLDPGVYSVTEIDVPEGYIKNTGEWHVELFPGKDSELVVTNDRKSDLTIRKTDKDTGEAISGVTFTLNKVDGATITTEPTGKDGTVTIERLEPGVYTVTEQSVPEGYILDTEPQMITIFPNRNASIHFQNYKRPTLTISKVDINGNLLPGAIFEVKTKAGVKIGDFPVSKDGQVTISNVHLTEGYYIITEIQAPEGYILDSTPHEVYLRPGKTTEISIENEKKPDLTIRKIDSVVGDGVKGAKFEIWVAKDGNQNGTYQHLDKRYYYTDENGLIQLDDLDTGWYKIKEVEPPTGFMLKEPSEQTIYVEHDKAVEVTFENIPKSALVVRKIDSDTGAPLANAWFRVRYLGGTSGSSGTIIGEYNTSANGNIVVTGLDAGTYIVEEINAPDGYVIDTAPQTAYISGKEQDCITLTFTNSKNGALLIKKVDSVTGKPLSDVEFFVTTSDGTVVGNANGKFVTDSAGTILISNVTPGTTLVVKETKTREGYVLDETPQNIKVQSNATMTLEFRNQPMGNLIINKLDSITKKPLKDVEFKITYADGSYVDAEGGKLSSKGVYVTDANGQITLSGVYGTLVVTEEKTIDGYSIDPATRSQSVVVNAGDTQSITVYNDPHGSLLITKVDSVTKEPLSDVEFKIAGCNGCEYPAGTYTTDSNGTIRLKSVPSGCYAISETKAKDGYLLDDTVHTVKVESGACKEVVFENSPLGGLVIKKMDAVSKEPLAGAIFRVTTADGAAVGNTGGEYRTDERGYITITDVKPSSLIVTEIKAPNGYLLDDTPKTIEIKDHQTYVLEFFNQPLGSLIIHKLDSVTKAPLEGVQFKITYADGRVVDADGGQLSSNGLYWTDENGQIKIDGIIGSVVVTEMETIEGYTIHEESRSQTVVVNTNDCQSLYFYNDPIGGVEIIKVNADKKTERIAHLFEYEDYCSSPTFGTASALITMALDTNAHQLQDRDGYLKYIATRPRVERRGDHGLFGSEDNIDLNSVMAEVGSHEGNVWTIIYSLRRSDAARLGYDNAASWRGLLLQHQSALADALKISDDHFRWYAAFHNEGNHPHIHMMLWSDEPKQGYLSRDGIELMRSKLTNTIFRDELHELYVQKDIAYKDLKYAAQEATQQLITQMEQQVYDSPVISQLMVRLADELQTVSGKKQYGYLQKPLKDLVDNIVDELSAFPDVAQCYDAWNHLRDELQGYYNQALREHLPLSQQKEFRAIKNMVIREAENIILDVLTFEDNHMTDEEEPPDEPIRIEEQDIYKQASAYQQAKALLNDWDIPMSEKSKAISSLETLWKEGYTVAAHLLGKHYRDGTEIFHDPEKAELWFRRSAEAGNDFSEYALGKLLLSQGQTTEAVDWLQKAADHGNQHAQYRLGKMYLSGDIIDKNIPQGIEHLTRSAVRGNQFAQYALGKLYLQGKFVPQDKKLAKSWLERSATQGNQYAQFFLNHFNDVRAPSVLLAATTLLYHMSNIFRDNSPATSNPAGLRIDSKRRRQLQRKRLAIGHKPDDHGDQIQQQSY